MKTRRFAILLALTMALALAACSGGGTQAETDLQAASAAVSPAEDAEGEKAYLDRVNALSEALSAFGTALSDALAMPEDKAATLAALEEARACQQPFLDFAASTEPAPEKYAAAHEALAAAAGDYGAMIGEYVDYMTAQTEGAADPVQGEALTARVAACSQAMEAAGKAVDALAAS